MALADFSEVEKVLNQITVLQITRNPVMEEDLRNQVMEEDLRNPVMEQDLRNLLTAIKDLQNPDLTDLTIIKDLKGDL